MGLRRAAWEQSVNSPTINGYFQQKQAADREAAQMQQKYDLDQQAAEANQDRLRQFLSGALGKGTQARSYNPETGAIGDARDPNSGLAALIGMQERRDSRDDKALEKLSSRVEKSGMGGIASPMHAIEKETGAISGQNMDTSKLPGRFTNTVRSVPLVGNALAGLAADSYGGREVMQNSQAVINQGLKALSGGNVTASEADRNAMEKGIGAFASEEDIANGLRIAHELMKNQEKSIHAGYDPQVVDRFKQQEGVAYSDMVNKATRARQNMLGADPQLGQAAGDESDAEYQEYLQLKAKHKRP